MNSAKAPQPGNRGAEQKHRTDSLRDHADVLADPHQGDEWVYRPPRRPCCPCGCSTRLPWLDDEDCAMHRVIGLRIVDYDDSPVAYDGRLTSVRRMREARAA